MRLFAQHAASTAPYQRDPQEGPESAREDGIVAQPRGPWNWPLMFSGPERAILELLNERLDHESFHQADMIMQGLSTLRPRRLQKLLADCRSVKVKRLFFFFADRHQRGWLKRIDRKAIGLGRGKRMLVRGGKLDSKHLITVPEDLDGLRSPARAPGSPAGLVASYLFQR
jgi:hypothetical protein